MIAVAAPNSKIVNKLTILFDACAINMANRKCNGIENSTMAKPTMLALSSLRMIQKYADSAIGTSPEKTAPWKMEVTSSLNGIAWFRPWR